MSGEAPLGWRSGAFSDFIVLQRGYDLPVQDRRGGDVPVFASNGQIATHSVAQIAGPSVVTGRSGTLGKVVFSPEPSWPLNTTLYVKDFRGNDPEFVYRFLQFFRLERFGTGTGVPTLNRNVVHSESVVFPPVAEQRRIAEILSSVDEAIQATQAVIEQTRKVKDGVLQRLLTRGIGHTRFKQTEIGEIPEEWEVRTLHEAGALILDGDRGTAYPKQSDYSDSGFCLFLSAQNVTKSGFKFDYCQFITEEKHKTLRSGTLQRGDIVVTTRGTVGNFAFVNDAVPFDVIRVNSGMAIIRLRQSSLDSGFVYALMNSRVITSQLERLIFGSAQPQLTLGIIRNLLVPVPPEDEQVLVARNASVLDEQHVSARRYLAQLKLVKSELASDLLTGRRRVSTDLPLAAE